jgi:hypothetical protein
VASHTDIATERLLKHSQQGSRLADAVKLTAAEVGPDPSSGAELRILTSGGQHCCGEVRFHKTHLLFETRANPDPTDTLRKSTLKRPPSTPQVRQRAVWRSLSGKPASEHFAELNRCHPRRSRKRLPHPPQSARRRFHRAPHRPAVVGQISRKAMLCATPTCDNRPAVDG